MIPVCQEKHWPVSLTRLEIEIKTKQSSQNQYALEIMQKAMQERAVYESQLPHMAKEATLKGSASVMRSQVLDIG